MTNLAGLLTVLLLNASPARACLLAPPTEHQLDSEEQLLDTSPPDQVAMPTYSIGRGEGGQLGCSSDSCDAFGTLKLEIVAPADDRTGPPDMGYRIEYLDGDMPADLLPSYDVRPDQGVIYLHWGDQATNNQEAFYFRLSIRAVDLGGNLSELATELEIHHMGSCGCGSQRFGPTELMLVGVLLMLWCLRRNT